MSAGIDEWKERGYLELVNRNLLVATVSRKEKVLKSTMKARKMSDMQMALTERMERPRVRFQIM